MNHRSAKMQLKVTIPALTCVIISTATAMLLVCATNQRDNEAQLDQISTLPKSSNYPVRKASLNELINKPSVQDLKPLTAVQNVSIQEYRSGDIQAQTSILRPLIMKHLMSGGKRRPVVSGSAESEEEEEVTKTIVVPVNPHDAEFKVGGKQAETSESSVGPNDHMIQYISGAQMKLSGSADSGIDIQRGANQKSIAGETSATQPNAEASLRLTSTEIGGLLNDREAPEFYRERELNGDGVMVGEEHPSSVSGSHNSFSSASSRLGMAASGHLGSHLMGGGGSGSAGFRESMPYANSLGFDSSDAALYRHRLNQAASEGAYAGGGGFNHRFGQQAFGTGGESELAYGPGAGGLMQAPNEYNEINSMGATGGYMGEAQSHSYGGGDFSPHSGLLRAGSEGMYAGGAMGLSGVSGSAGFMGHGGSLETAAAGGYGLGSAEIGPSAELMGHSNAFPSAGQLQAHASYNPYMQTAAEADYANRFGQHQGAGFSPMADYGDQRGFASQNSHQLLRSATSGNAHPSNMANSRGLMPLTPTVPLPEELPSPVTSPSVLSSNQREQISQRPADLANLVRHQHNLRQQQRFVPRTRPSSQQIHEALEEDPTDTSSDDELSGHQQTAQQNYETITGTSEAEESVASARPAEQQMSRFTGESGPSLVLNLPPPADQSAPAPVTQMVEFSRVGSAGYLGPRGSSLSKKSGQRHFQHQQEAEADDESHGASSSEDPTSDSDPIENPAHAGKYIID